MKVEEANVLGTFSRALQREAHILQESPDLLWQQMYNRLQWEGGWITKQIEPEFQLRSQTSYHLWFHNHNRLRESKSFLFTLKGHSDIVTDCIFSPNGKILASTSVDKTVRLWDATNGGEIAVLKWHTGPVWGCSFSPDGYLLASAGFDATVRLWKVDTHQPMVCLTGHKDRVTDCAFSPDGKLIISASDDNTLRIWDVSTGKHLKTLTGHAPTKSFWRAPTDGHVNTCLFSPDGYWALSGSDDRTLKLWNLDENESPLTLTGHKSAINRCAFSPDGRWFISASEDKTLKIFTPKNGKTIKTLRGHQGSVIDCAISPDGHWIVSAGDDGILKIWDVVSGKEICSFEGHSSVVTACAINPDGNRIASASADRTIRMWQTQFEKGEELSPKPHQIYTSACCYTPNGHEFASVSWDRSIKLWDVSLFKMRKKFSGHEGFITACDLSKDGRRLVSAGADQTLRIWDVRSGGQLATLVGHTGPIYSCAFSPDGSTIVSGGHDSTLQIWDVQKEKHVNTLKGHTEPVYACRYHPDGTRILSVSDDQTLRIWDAFRNKEIRCMAIQSGAVLAISPACDQIVSAGSPQTVTLWELDHPENTLELMGHKDWVRSACFSCDGKLVFTVSSDRTLRVWQSISGDILGAFNLPNNLFFVIAHPFLPEVVCGDALGYIWRVTLKGISLGPIRVTPFENPQNLSVQCPVCGKIISIEREKMGQTITCPAKNCQQHLQVNNFTTITHNVSERKGGQHG